MSVRLFYVDESYDSNRFCLSAVGIRHADWRDCFNRVRQHRAALKQDYGILLRSEIHAHEFVSGRGRMSAERIIEDPVFKQSHESYFIQLADCVASSLLKREVPPTPLVRRYEIHRMFERSIGAVCLRAASPQDPFGIVRK